MAAIQVHTLIYNLPKQGALHVVLDVLGAKRNQRKCLAIGPLESGIVLVANPDDCLLP
jgi:hypothetical protein